jgi:predicted metalloprotease with PDZ domain
VRRAGLQTQEQYFDSLTRNIGGYENVPGHLFQSAASASINVWHRGDDAANTTISFYNKGAAIGALMDFKIRNETELRAQPGPYLGADFPGAGGRGGGRGGATAAGSHVISRVEYDSPAEHAGLSAQDEVLAIDGVIGPELIAHGWRCRR